MKGSDWWLRSLGNNDNNAADVNSDGYANPNGNNVNNSNNGVRPDLHYIWPDIFSKVEGSVPDAKEPDSIPAVISRISYFCQAGKITAARQGTAWKCFSSVRSRIWLPGSHVKL